MKRQLVFLFSGQGSQYHQMGLELYERNDVFRDCLDRLDKVPLRLMEASVVRELYGEHRKSAPFDRLRLSHPAIFMVEFALASVVMAQGIEPDATFGSSLGMYAALAVAGGMSAEEALSMVVHHAQVVERHCPTGAMIAVLHDDRLFDDSPFLQTHTALAGRNFASHFVLSMPQANVMSVEAFLTRAGATHVKLPVAYPFHSAWIEPMNGVFVGSVSASHVRLPSMPVFCCATGGRLRSIPNDYFWRVARGEMFFNLAVDNLEASGPCDYLDLGPSGTLAGFLKHFLPKESASRVLVGMTPFGRDIDVLAKATAALKPGR